MVVVSVDDRVICIIPNVVCCLWH